jgi:uncharacterized membrane protein YhaH (DUF805 family)
MRRFLTIALACALGLVAAFVFAHAAETIRPCTGEQLSCSITRAIGVIYIPVFSAIALVAFSIAVFWKNTAQAMNVAGTIPLGAFLLLMTYIKWSEFSVREFHDIRERDIQELFQIILPIALTMIVPWIVLQRTAVRTETGKTSHG